MNKEQDSYSHIATVFTKIAKHHGAYVPEEVNLCWEVLGSAMKAADTELDSSADKDKRQNLVNTASEFLLGGIEEFPQGNEQLRDLMGSLRERLNELGDDRKHLFVRNMRVLCKITEKLREAKTISELSFLTRVEGQITARMFTCLMPEPTRNEGVARAQLFRLTSRLGRVANNIDTFVDFGDDKADEIVHVEASWKNRTRLLIDVAGDSRTLLKGLTPKMVLELKSSVADVVKQKKS